MASILPIVGGSNATWGGLLYTFLTKQHVEDDGGHKDLTTNTITVSGKTTGIFKASGLTVPKFDGSGTAKVAGTNTFEDVDISSIVGANVSFVYLLATSTVAAGYISVKTKGLGGTGAEHGSDVANDCGCSHAHIVTAGDYVNLVVSTDSSGIFQLAANSTTPLLTVTVVGYIS